MREDIESCVPCQASTDQKVREPIKASPLPEEPRSKISVDLFKLPSGKQLLVIIYDFSKFPVVEEVSTTSFESVSG